MTWDSPELGECIGGRRVGVGVRGKNDICRVSLLPHGVLSVLIGGLAGILHSQEWNKKPFSEREESGSNGATHARSLERSHLNLTPSLPSATWCSSWAMAPHGFASVYSCESSLLDRHCPFGKHLTPG